MKSKMLRIVFTLFVALSFWQMPAALGNCTDFMVPGEFPPEIITQNGTTLLFTYQFGDADNYSYTWVKGPVSGGPIGPNALQPSCKLPQISYENDDFLILEKGCGTFCWSFEILGLYPVGASTTGTYQTIDRPLAFDSARNLIAYYRDKDVIGIKNLLSGYEQIFATRYACDTSSGLCFSDVTFRPDRLDYKWESPTGVDPGEVLSQQLDEALFRNE